MNVVMILIEGPDDTGKSTLAEKLHQDLHAPVIRSHRKWENWISQGQFWMDQEWPGLVIFDRFAWISEPVYGPILRPEESTSHLGGGDYNFVLDRMVNPCNRIVVISCMAVAGSDRPQMEGVKEHHNEIVEAYQYVFSDLREGGVLVMDYDHRMGNEEYVSWLSALIGAIENINDVSVADEDGEEE